MAEERYLKEYPSKEVPDSITTWSRDEATTTAYLKNSDTLPALCYNKDCEGTYFAKKTLKLIRKHKGKPFFATIGFHEPHAPFNFPIEYRDKYDSDEVPLPKGSPEDDRWVPEQFKNLTEDQRRGIIARIILRSSIWVKMWALFWMASGKADLNLHYFFEVKYYSSV